MSTKTCDPRCRGRCNKTRISQEIIDGTDKACDPKCIARCSKKSIENSTSSEKKGIVDVRTEIAEKPLMPKVIEENSENKIIVDIRTEIAEKPPMPRVIEENSENKIITTTADLKTDEIGFAIIDLDGVILDIEAVYVRVISDIAQKYNIPQSEISKIIDAQDGATFAKICKNYQLSTSPEAFLTEFKNISIRQLANTPLIPGIENLVDYFMKNNIQVAVATTSNENAFKLKTHKYKKFFQKFDHIVLGSDPEVSERKPSPKIYEVCGSRFKTKPRPNNILVLEDAPEGVIAAKKAGMSVAWFPNKYMNREDGKEAKAIFNSLKDFKPETFGLPAMV